MAKLTDKSISGTSFHFTTIRTTVNKLIDTIGHPQCFDNTGDDKVNFEWDCETEEGDVFTIYDWKEYRPLGYDELIDFHIGGFDKIVTEKAKRELLDLLR